MGWGVSVYFYDFGGVGGFGCGVIGAGNWGGKERGEYTFSLGKFVSIPGKESKTPFGVLDIGQVLNN